MCYGCTLFSVIPMSWPLWHSRTLTDFPFLHWNLCHNLAHFIMKQHMSIHLLFFCFSGFFTSAFLFLIGKGNYLYIEPPSSHFEWLPISYSFVLLLGMYSPFFCCCFSWGSLIMWSNCFIFGTWLLYPRIWSCLFIYIWLLFWGLNHTFPFFLCLLLLLF